MEPNLAVHTIALTFSLNGFQVGRETAGIDLEASARAYATAWATAVQAAYPATQVVFTITGDDVPPDGRAVSVEPDDLTQTEYDLLAGAIHRLAMQTWEAGGWIVAAAPSSDGSGQDR